MEGSVSTMLSRRSFLAALAAGCSGPGIEHGLGADPLYSAPVYDTPIRTASIRQVYIYAGASVVGGQDSDSSILPTHYTGSDGNGPPVDLRAPQPYSRLTSQRSGSGLDGDIGWRDMQPGAEHHSLELSFAYNMHHIHGVEQTAVVVHGVGGSGLENDWLDGAILKNCLARTQSELATLDSEHTVRGVILHCAAVDADESPDSANYQANLARFIARFRALWPDASFIIARPSMRLAAEGFGDGTLGAAVDAYVRTDSNSIAFNTDDVEFTGDGPHYRTPELILLGGRAAYCASQLLHLPRRGGIVTN